MKKIAIISEGCLPVPPVRGGAVPTLVQILIDENEVKKALYFDVYSIGDSLIEREKIKCENSKYEFIDIPRIVKLADNLIYFIAKKILKIYKHMSFRFMIQRIYYILMVSKKIRKKNYDYILIENSTTLFWIFKFYGNRKRYENKCIYHMHNLISNNFGCEKILSLGKVYGVSQYVIDEFCKDLAVNKEKNCRVLKNCIDINKFSINKAAINIREKYGIEEDERVIIFVGRLVEQKGVLELIKAFENANYERMRLLIVGSYMFDTDMISAYETELYDCAKRMEGRVIFTGFVHNDILFNYYNSADLAVFPSLCVEAAGLTILEALACGVPVITTDVGGITEYVNEECAIILNPEYNLINELATNINELVNDERKLFELREKAKKVSGIYCPSNYYNNFLELIMEE